MSVLLLTWFYCYRETQKTVNAIVARHCLARKKPIGREKTKTQTAT